MRADNEQVIGDVLCGTSSAGFNATAPLDPTISKSSKFEVADPLRDKVTDVM